MQERVISFKVAKLAKEKGFNLNVHYYFCKHNYDKKYHEYMGYDDEYWGDNYEYDWNTNGEPFKPFNKGCFSRPTQSLLQKWLREVHKIHCYADCCAKGWFWGVEEIHGRPIISQEIGEKEYNSYEEALEIGLYKALKLIGKNDI